MTDRTIELDQHRSGGIRNALGTNTALSFSNSSRSYDATWHAVRFDNMGQRTPWVRCLRRWLLPLPKAISS